MLRFETIEVGFVEGGREQFVNGLDGDLEKKTMLNLRMDTQAL